MLTTAASDRQVDGPLTPSRPLWHTNLQLVKYKSSLSASSDNRQRGPELCYFTEHFTHDIQRFSYHFVCRIKKLKLYIPLSNNKVLEYECQFRMKCFYISEQTYEFITKCKILLQPCSQNKVNEQACCEAYFKWTFLFWMQTVVKSVAKQVTN